MPIMYPNEFPTKKFYKDELKEKNGTDFEKKLYEFIRNSNDTDDIIFIYGLHQLNREIELNDGELDFLIISKNYGIIILEAKGGHKPYKYENGNIMRWKKVKENGYYIPFNPVNQANKQKEKLYNYIKNQNNKVADNKKVNISYSSIKYCVAFEKYLGKPYDECYGEFGKENIINRFIY